MTPVIEKSAICLQAEPTRSQNSSGPTWVKNSSGSGRLDMKILPGRLGFKILSGRAGRLGLRILLGRTGLIYIPSYNNSISKNPWIFFLIWCLGPVFAGEAVLKFPVDTDRSERESSSHHKFLIWFPKNLDLQS